jgi:hypothetical protein
MARQFWFVLLLIHNPIRLERFIVQKTKLCKDISLAAENREQQLEICDYFSCNIVPSGVKYVPIGFYQEEIRAISSAGRAADS